METLQIKPYFKERGLTLIEVLIALAIISIALTAVIKAASQNIRATHYLQNKTIAMWVGIQAINEIRAGVLKLPTTQDKLEATTYMLGQHWYWQVGQEETPNKRIKKIAVDVYERENMTDEDTPIISLESYLYDEK